MQSHICLLIMLLFFRKFPLKHYMILSLLVVECRAAPELAKDDSRLLLFGD